MWLWQWPLGQHSQIDLDFIGSCPLDLWAMKLLVDHEGHTQFPWWFHLIRANKLADEETWGEETEKERLHDCVCMCEREG